MLSEYINVAEAFKNMKILPNWPIIEKIFLIMKNQIITLILAASLLQLSPLALGQARQRMVLPTVVEVAPVKAVPIEKKISTTGTIVAIPGIVVKPETSGRITKMFFKPGDDVQAGTPLIEINPDPLKAQLNEDKADLELAELNYNRYAELYKEHVVSKADYDQKRTDLDASKGKVDNTIALLKQTTVVAPFSGRLGLNIVNLGDYVGAGQSIVSLQMLDPIHVNFTIPEIYLSQISVGQQIIIHSDAYPDENFEGKIEAIDPLLDQNTRSVNARAMVLNKDKKLLPGSFAQVTVITSLPQSQIVIPQTALVFSPDGNYVYRLISGKVVKTPVTFGKRDPQNVVIEKGLKVGDVIVTAGQLKITGDNIPVIVANQPKKPAAETKTGSTKK